MNKTKFLGVIINSNLKWDDHINTIQTKISKNIGILFKTRLNLPLSTLCNLYHTLILPYLQYCNIVWATHNCSALQSLFRTQKRAVRTLVFAKRIEHTAPIFRRLKLLTVTKINDFQTACLVYKSINYLLPDHFNSFFIFNHKIHQHNTRQSSKLHCIPHRLNLRRDSFRFHGTKIWNSLNNNLAQSSSLHIFKKHYFNYLLLSED